VLAIGVLAAAFVGLSSDDPPPAVTRTQIVTTQPGAVPVTPAATSAPASQPTTGTTGGTTDGTGGASAP